jgi:hypothetical protein
MAWRLTSGFAVETFDRRRARSPRLTEYFTIYVQNLTPAHRTKTSELQEFLARPDQGREVVYFGLSYYGKPCGFATLMFYPEAGLGVFDHVTIAPTDRGSTRSVNMTISLAFLAPKLVKAAIDGRLPRGIGMARLCDPPAEWADQYRKLGLTGI